MKWLDDVSLGKPQMIIMMTDFTIILVKKENLSPPRKRKSSEGTK